MKCVEVYKELYPQKPFDVAFCPYHISPLGAHVDYQYVKINGLAIDKGIHMTYHPQQNGVVELQSLNFPKRAQFFISAVPEEEQGDWADHLRGCYKDAGRKVSIESWSVWHHRGKSADWWFVLVGISYYLFLVCTVQGEWYPSGTAGDNPHGKSSIESVCWCFLRQARPEL